MPNKRHASQDLQSLIELANSVEPELDLPEPRGRVEEIVELLKTEAFARFRELKGPIEPDTILAKLGFPEGATTYRRAIGKYIELRDGRAWLREAARIAQLPRMHYLMPHVSAYTNEHGELTFDVAPLVKTLAGVDVSRIRVCPICQLIYWAARNDKPCCSDRCASVRTTRRWRESYKIKYRDQRSERNAARRDRKEELERQRLKQLTAATHSHRSVRLPVPKELCSEKSESLLKTEDAIRASLTEKPMHVSAGAKIPKTPVEKIPTPSRNPGPTPKGGRSETC
jgi:endogenous inhibitor of DNA gyrase (YacG/DUF329 family)